MKRVMHSELAHWLKTATQGLPKREAAITEMELYSHYEDAVDDYRAQGKSAEEAHQQAMIDLGGAEATSSGLRDVHLGTRRYAIASALSLMVLVVLYGVPIIFHNLDADPFSTTGFIIYALFFGSLFVMSSIVMSVVRDLLSWRFAVKGLTLPFWLMVGGLGTYVSADLITLTAFDYAVGYGNGPSIFTLTNPVQILFALIAYLSQIAVSVGLLTYALRIQSVRRYLYGLGLPLAVTLGLLAVAVASTATAVVVGSRTVELIMILVENFTHTVLWPLLVLLFYRAIYRRIQLPRQFA